MTRAFVSELWTFLKQVLLLWRARPGWGYVAFAQIGLALITLSVSILVPGVWETIIEVVAKVTVADRTDLSVGIKLIIAATLGFAGFSLIVGSFWFYHRTIQKLGPSKENDGAISTVVQPNTSLETLVMAFAKPCLKSVDLSEMSPDDRASLVTEGPLDASDFGKFLDRVAERTRPPLQIAWKLTGGNYYSIRPKPSPRAN